MLAVIFYSSCSSSCLRFCRLISSTVAPAATAVSAPQVRCRRCCSPISCCNPGPCCLSCLCRCPRSCSPCCMSAIPCGRSGTAALASTTVRISGGQHGALASFCYWSRAGCPGLLKSSCAGRFKEHAQADGARPDRSGYNGGLYFHHNSSAVFPSQQQCGAASGQG